MNYKELKDLLSQSRTTRRFDKNYKVSLKDLKDLIELARITSSAMNAQPLKYILVTKKDDVLKLARNSTWAGALPSWTQSEEERPSAFIIVLNDKNINGYSMLDTGTSLLAIGLGAKTKGLSICPLASTNKEVCKKLFNISDNFEVLITIAVGKGVEEVRLVDVNNGNINYYRDENQTHYVPKRSLKEVIVGEF